MDDHDPMASWEVARAHRVRGLAPVPGVWFYFFLIGLWSIALRFGQWLHGMVFS